MNHICLADTPLIGNYSWKGRLDLLNIVMVGLPNRAPEQKETYKLHRLLSVLLSKTIQPSERIAIVQDEYNIEMEREMRKELIEMCNLSQGIREDAQKEEIKLGIKEAHRKDAIRLYQKGKDVEFIADMLDESVHQVEEWLGLIIA